VKSEEITYEILRIRDFGKAMHRRNVKVRIFNYGPSEDSLKKLAESIWLQHGQDVEELTAVFYLPGMNPKSTGFALGGCMKGKGCYVSIDAF